MQRLSLLLIVLFIFGCGGDNEDPNDDPYAKYRDAQLRQKMTIVEIKKEFGEPDSYRNYWDNARYGYRADKRDKNHERHVETLKYGAFDVHYEKIGNVTGHCLSPLCQYK